MQPQIPEPQPQQQQQQQQQAEPLPPPIPDKELSKRVFSLLRAWGQGNIQFEGDDEFCALCEQQLKIGDLVSNLLIHTLGLHGHLLREALFPSVRSSDVAHIEYKQIRCVFKVVDVVEDAAETAMWPDRKITSVEGKRKNWQVHQYITPLPKNPRTRALLEEVDAFMENVSRSARAPPRFRCGICSQTNPKMPYTCKKDSLRFHILTNHLEHRLLELLKNLDRHIALHDQTSVSPLLFLKL